MVNILEGSGHAYFKALSQSLCGGNQDKFWTPQ
jgi:hypothetical protein